MANTYAVTDRMAQIINGNYRLLQVLSRFGMSLGFGDKTVAEVCGMYGVDADTFLAVINFIQSGYTQVDDNLDRISVPTLMEYLRQSHRYFTEFQLPRIGLALRAVLAKGKERQIPALILQQFNDYVDSLARHMRVEEEELFPYVERLLRGERVDDRQLVTFSRHHHAADDELGELKRILIKYIPSELGGTGLNDVLYQIYTCEDEIDAHCKAEDYIFVPCVFNLEERLRRS